MKKMIITTLAIVTTIGIAATMVLSTDAFANIDTKTKTETSPEVLAHFKSINPSITNSEVDSIMEQRNQLDELHKQIEKLELDYGILVDNTKDPNKEPKSIDDLTAEQRKNYIELRVKFWDGEIQFLDAQYKAGLIKKDIYKEDKKNFEVARKNCIE
ncbi:hypothetical protein M3215_09905 [Bacillus cytotoxicus]|uniref:Uncharacterized protein n=1 Tax=Bacillus cytotoxicus TaxID=580165 RepID=A0ACC6A5J1_9BACI|nr:hypothetical protein [Bacillus cytotoxicus]